MYIAQITMILYLIVEAHSAYHYLLYARYNGCVHCPSLSLLVPADHLAKAH